MHFFLSWLVLVLGLFGATTAEAKSQLRSERDSVAMLTIGNSFADDATAYLPKLAEAGGKTLVIFRANLGGSSMERHAGHLQAAEANPADPAGRPYEKRTHPVTGETRDFSLPEALQMHRWDFVTIQQVSQLSFRPETYHPYVDQLVAAIKKYAPQAEILIHETWAYREDHAMFKKSDGFTPAKMYEGLRAAYGQIAAETGSRIVPVGDAFNAARRTSRWNFSPDAKFDYTNPPPEQLPKETGSLNTGWQWRKDPATGENEFHLDATHANVAGRYLGAAVFYETIFAAKKIPVTFIPEGLSPQEAKSLRKIAYKVVRSQRAREASAR